MITGAGEGIGFEIARQLCEKGARIVLNDVDGEKAEKAAQEIGSTQVCLPCAGDVSDNKVVQGMVDVAVDTFGRVDMAIANAGITLWNPFLEFTQEDFHRVVSVNLGGSFFLAQAAAKAMIARCQGGKILFTSSVTGRRAIPFLSAYSMTKAGVEGLTMNLVQELSPHGITVNAIAPGATLTPRNLADDPEYKTVWGALIPARDVALPADVARAALFLLHPSNHQINGQTLVIDGGWSKTSPIPSLDFVQSSDSPNHESSD